jgi:C4-dicarboxylate transporter
MNDILNNNGLWTVIGIIIGGAINHVFWTVQSKRQEKIEVRTSRQQKIVEICNFCSVLMEKTKFIYSLTVTGTARNYLSEHTNLWADVPLYNTRMTIQMFFPKCLDTFDELQITLANLVALMQKAMVGQPLTYGELDKSISAITDKVNILQNNLIDVYSKTLSIQEK